MLSKIRKGILAMALAMAVPAIADTPKYIFYFIGDGMGPVAVNNAQIYKRTVKGDNTPLTMMRMPYGGLVTTHSASSPVTDSAAAGTALATGSKTKNGMLGMDADTVAVTSMAKILHKNGFGIGLVTTVAPDDATPAAFYANVPNRGMFYEIGKDAAASGFEFLAGANLRGTRKKDGMPNDLMKIIEESGMEVVRGTDAVKDVTSRRVLLLSPDTTSMNEVGLAIDSIAGAMLLPDMTQACVDHLMKNSPEKFFMMVEGGSIDHAGHANDAATSIMETINFDNALNVAYRFYEAHPEETLIVVTADHETGGLATANRNHHYWVDFTPLQYQRISKDSFANWTRQEILSGREFTWPEMKEIISDKLGLYTNIPVDEKEDARLQEMFDKNFRQYKGEELKTLYNAYNEFCIELFDYMSRISGVGWTTNDHSGAMVPLYSVGVGADRISGTLDNTEIPGRILSVAGF